MPVKTELKTTSEAVEQIPELASLETIPTLSQEPTPQPEVKLYQFEAGAEEKFKFWESIGKEACPRCGDKLVHGGDYCNVGFDSNCPVVDGVV